MTLKAGESFHLLFEASGCQTNLKDGDLLERFINSIPEKIGMTLIQPARMTFLHAEDQIDSGWSCAAILAESHCSLHAFHNRQFVFFDIFSCKSFEVNKTLDILLGFFLPKDYDHKVITRGGLM